MEGTESILVNSLATFTPGFQLRHQLQLCKSKGCSYDKGQGLLGRDRGVGARVNVRVKGSVSVSVEIS